MGFELIGLGVGVFTLVVLSLVALILFAKSRLVASGEVSILVNGDEGKRILAPAGASLLSTLADAKIFVSSACGGGGHVLNVKLMC